MILELGENYESDSIGFVRNPDGFSEMEMVSRKVNLKVCEGKERGVRDVETRYCGMCVY